MANAGGLQRSSVLSPYGFSLSSHQRLCCQRCSIALLHAAANLLLAHVAPSIFDVDLHLIASLMMYRCLIAQATLATPMRAIMLLIILVGSNKHSVDVLPSSVQHLLRQLGSYLAAQNDLATTGQPGDSFWFVISKSPDSHLQKKQLTTCSKAYSPI